MAVITPTLADAVTAAQVNARAAKTSANAAASSAVDATLAATIVARNFNYGVLSSDPSTRPDLTASQESDIYYNSLSRALKMYVAGRWEIIATSVAAGVLISGQNLNDVSSKPQARTNLGLGSAAILAAGSANGVATLGAGGKVPAAQLDIAAAGGLVVTSNLADLDDAATARTNLELGTAALLDAGTDLATLTAGKVPMEQLSAGTANGVALLDALGHVSTAQLNAGASNGIAQLNASGVVPTSQLPAFGNPISVVKSADYTTISGDAGKVISVTTGSGADVSITLVGANTAGDGAPMIVQKADSGTKKCIVLDSNGSTNIAWLTNQWDAVCFRSNGSVWSVYWTRIAPRVETFLTNGTWTKAPLAATVLVDLLGAGGGAGSGGKGNSSCGGSGGGGGARMLQWFRAAELSSTETVAVPTGGTGATGTTTGQPGNDPSGPTTFGSTVRMSVSGGKGGPAGTQTSSPSAGSAGGSQWAFAIAAADAVVFEGAGAAAAVATTPGNNANYGGAGGGVGAPTATPGAGGSSFLGGGGGGAGAGRSGSTIGGAGGKTGAYTPGGGGAGGATGSTSSPGSGGGTLGFGGGGGGAASGAGNNGGVGGNGGVGAGGGGGGSTGGTGGNGGSGGNGGTGQAIVTTVFS